MEVFSVFDVLVANWQLNECFAFSLVWPIGPAFFTPVVWSVISQSCIFALP